MNLVRRPSVPFTAIGFLMVALAIIGFLAGWQLGWIELTVFGSGCALALLVALPFVIGRMRVEITRGLAPQRVMVGDDAVAQIDIRNPRSTALRSRTIEDLVAGSDGKPKRHRSIAVPRLAAGARHLVEYPLPTGSRGRYEVGPAVIARADPLHLMRREVRHTGSDTLWVHPRYQAVSALPVGFAKDLEGPTSDTSPIGDVAFHSLREYEPGDDFRHIHWMSTARANTPMVRHYVDNRRPYLAVLLDDRVSAMGPEQFEVAVEVAATMSVSALLHREQVTVWGTMAPILGRGNPGGSDDLLDRLATVHQVDGAAPGATGTLLVRSERSVSAITLVTGGAPSADLLLFVERLRRKVRVIIVRVWPAGEVRHGVLPGARLIDADSLSMFAGAWQGMIR